MARVRRSTRRGLSLALCVLAASLVPAAAGTASQLEPLAVAAGARPMAEVSLGSLHLVRPLRRAVPRVLAGQRYRVRAWLQTHGRHLAGHAVLTVFESNGRRLVAGRSVVRRLARREVLTLTFRARHQGDALGVVLRAAHPRRVRETVTVRRVTFTLAHATPARPAPRRAVPAQSSGTAPCSPAFGSFSTVNQPPACWRPYGEDSPLNQPLPASPRVYPQSDAIVRDLSQNRVHFEDGPDKFALVTPGRQPVYWSSPSDPAVTIKCTYEWGPGTCNGYDHASLDGTTIHVPAGAEPEHATDARLSVIDQAAHVEYDFDHAAWSNDHRTLIVYSAGTLPIGTPSATGFGNGTTASGFGNLAGIITPSELVAGQIDHALAISLPCTAGSVWPARSANGFSCHDIPGHSDDGAVPAPMGALFQLNLSDAQIAATGAPRWEQAVMRAMAHYGLYVNDTNGAGDAHSIETELIDDLSYTSFGQPGAMGDALKHLGGYYYSPLSRWILSGLPIDVSRLRVIDPCVKRGTCG